MIETAYPHEIPKLTAEEQKDLCTITDLLAKHKNKNFRDAVAHDMYMYNDLDAMINIHTANLRPTKSLGVRETESMAVGD